jgi:tetratricopeptide (TPR) repeat protein
LGSSYDLQMETARACLGHSVSLHGEGSIQLVPAYALLASAHLAIGRIHEAEELLATANWAVVKAGDAAPPSERGRVARGFGRLSAARADLDKAIQCFSEAAYEVSLVDGPESVDAAHLFFELGNVFDRKALDLAGQEGPFEDMVGRALACYDKTVACWYKALQASRKGEKTPPSVDLAAWHVTKEGVNVLEALVHACGVRLGKTHTAVYEAKFTLALLHWARGELSSAAELCEEVLKHYRTEYGDHVDATVDAAATLEAIQEGVVA